MRVTLFHNPSAGDAPLTADQLTSILSDAGYQVHYQSTKDDLSAVLEDVGDLAIVAGGDGTVAKVARALADTDIPLAVLPMGTANDFARTLEVPTALPEACKIITEGVLHAVDLGSVNGKYFLNVASMGLSVECARRLTGEDKRRWGVLGYAISAVDALKASRSFWASITCDGEHHRFRSIQIAVGNGRH